MSNKEKLKEFDSGELIAELEDRGDMPPEMTIDDFGYYELRAALGIEDDTDVEWGEFYLLLASGRQDVAFAEFKKLVEDKTGRILV